MATLPTECNILQLSTLHDCSVCIIDISHNKGSMDYQELVECPICLEQITATDPILILACCKNKVHLKCLCDWYNDDRVNINCFICNQSNPFGDDILQYTDSDSDLSEIPNSLSRQGEVMRSRLIHRASRLEEQQIQSKKVFSLLICSFIIFGVIILVTLLIIDH